MIYLKTILAAVAILMTASSLKAQDAVNEEALKLSNEIIELSRAADGLKQMVPAMMQQQTMAMRSKYASNPDKLAKFDDLMNRISDEMMAAMPELMNEVAAAYARKFSVEDLRGLRDFYASDLGQRFANGSQELTMEMATLGQRWAMKTLFPVMSKATAELKALDAE